MISKASIITPILVIMFAITILSSNSITTSYGYSPCNCVIFVMDDIADYGFIKVQLATMDYFLDRNLPFTASIVTSLFANSSNLDVFHKVEEGVDRGLFEIAIHGYRHVNHSLLTKEEQLNDFSKAKGKLEYLFGKRVDVLSPPYNEFNLHTIEAMSDLNITLLSTSDGAEKRTTNPYKLPTVVITNNSRLEVSKINDQKPLVYHAPVSASLFNLHGNGLSGDGLVQEVLRRIEDSIASQGFASVKLHLGIFLKMMQLVERVSMK